MHHAQTRFGGQHAPDCLCRDCRDSCVPMTGEHHVTIPIPVVRDQQLALTFITYRPR